MDACASCKGPWPATLTEREVRPRQGCRGPNQGRAHTTQGSNRTSAIGCVDVNDWGKRRCGGDCAVGCEDDENGFETDADSCLSTAVALCLKVGNSGHSGCGV